MNRHEFAALLRCEVRELTRNPRRAASTAALAGVPAAAMFAGGALLRSTQPPTGSTPDPFVALVVFVIGGLAFLEAGLVVAAAFTVGLSRRQREIGLLGAAGARPAALVTAWVVTQMTLALLGATVGLVLGAGAARLLHPFLEGWVSQPVFPLEFQLRDGLGALALCLVAAFVATAWPARQAARWPVRVALSGRRPRPVDARRHGWAGVALFGVGLGLSAAGVAAGERASGLWLVFGGALTLFGACAAVPAILQELAQRSSRLPLAWRLACRDASRLRSRHTPVVAAVLASFALCISLTAVVESVQAFLLAQDSATRLSEQPGGRVFYVSLALCAATSLIVLLVSAALSSVESAEDEEVLVRVGGAPDLVHRIAAARASVLAAVGGALGVPVGLVPAYGVTRASEAPIEFTIPWLQIALALLLVPSLAYAAVGLLSRFTPWFRAPLGGGERLRVPAPRI